MVWVLRHWASFDVVGDPYYIVGYAALGIVWITCSVLLQAALVDVRFQQDVRDRNNFAAAIALGGLLIANAAAFAGANVGDGPGWWVVLFSAIVSTAAVTAAVWLLAAFTDAEERITIDHDYGAAIRFAAIAIAVGVVAGRGAAGNWVSVDATVHDFAAVAWPIVPALAAALVYERATPPIYAEASPLRSYAFAAAAVVLAYVYVSGLRAP
jgi:hypothetical protein